MSDETSKLILGDTGVSAIDRSGRRGLFRRRGNRERPPFSHCENCGAELTGQYCSQCGQPAIDYRRSFRHVIVDVLDSFLNWDSKFFATIGLLIWAPWRLTNSFIEGKRVRYLHPLRLYLLASVLFFFAVSYGAKSVNLDAKHLSEGDRTQIQSEINNDKDLSPQIRAKVEKALQKASPAAAATTGSVSPTPTVPAHSPPPAVVAPAPSKPKAAASNNEPDASPGEKKDERDFGPFLKLSDKPGSPFEQWIEDRAKEKIGEHGSKAQLFFMSMVNNLPYMMLASIPLFALVLKLLYIRRHVFYIDHLVYALHIHSFTYLAVMLIGLATIGLNRAGGGLLAGWTIGLLWFAFSVQIFLSIRRVYRQGWIRTFLKFWLGGFVYLVILTAAFVATFLVTLAVP